MLVGCLIDCKSMHTRRIRIDYAKLFEWLGRDDRLVYSGICYVVGRRGNVPGFVKMVEESGFVTKVMPVGYWHAQMALDAMGMVGKVDKLVVVSCCTELRCLESLGVPFEFWEELPSGVLLGDVGSVVRRNDSGVPIVQT